MLNINLPWYVEFSAVATVLLIVSVVLQWAYRLVCRRNLRYWKAYSLLFVLFFVHLTVDFLCESVLASQVLIAGVNGRLLEWCILFVVGILLFGRWMNTKRKKPIGSVMGFLVQVTFCAIIAAISLVISIPFILFLG
jgi:hypothetical protein|tara:strand:+ start:1293 stop:1703 length:411 start_codon:yes stop_codon:yes gene_type:complete